MTSGRYKVIGYPIQNKWSFEIWLDSRRITAGWADSEDSLLQDAESYIYDEISGLRNKLAYMTDALNKLTTRHEQTRS